MQTCAWCINQSTLERCERPATKCVIITGFDRDENDPEDKGDVYSNKIWLCDLHYADPETRAWWTEIGCTWEY